MLNCLNRETNRKWRRLLPQIIVALANQKMCENLHLMGKLVLFERDRRETLTDYLP